MSGRGRGQSNPNKQRPSSGASYRFSAGYWNRPDAIDMKTCLELSVSILPSGAYYVYWKMRTNHPAERLGSLDRVARLVDRLAKGEAEMSGEESEPGSEQP